MKNLILSVILIFSSIFGFTQTYYKASITEMYTWNRVEKEWELYQKNSDVNITVVIEDQFINIQAKNPSMYKIYLNSKEELKTKTLSGFRYSAKNLKEDNIVKIDVLVSNESPIAVVSIIDMDEGYNLRFFLTKVIE
jgi:thiamine pyrophosphokinase